MPSIELAANDDFALIPADDALVSKPVSVVSAKRLASSDSADEIRSALDRCRKLRLQEVVLTPLGIAADDVPRHAAALVAGLAEAWAGCERPMRLQVCVPRAEVAGVYRAIESACGAASLEGVAVTTDDASLDGF